MSLGSIMSDEHKCVLIENQLTHENQKLFRQIQKEYQSAENQRLNRFEKCEYKIFKKLSEYNKQLEECKKRNPKKVKVYRTCTDALSSGLSLIAYWKAGVKGAAVGSNIGGYIGGGIGFGISCFTGAGVIPFTYRGIRVEKVVGGAVRFVGGVYNAY